MINFIYKFSLIIFLILKTNTVFAVWYQVEIIVFENNYPEADGEYWYKTPELVQLNDAVILQPIQRQIIWNEDTNENVSNIQITPQPYRILDEKKNRLDGIYRVLKLSSEYRPLYHISWQQQGLEGNRAKPVHIQTEDSRNLYGFSIPPLLANDSLPLELFEPIKLIVDGTLKIRSSLYLHVDLDFVLFRQPPEIEFIDGTNLEMGNELKQVRLIKPVDYVRLTESRRIKLNELHFFDHPLFGVIIQVSRTVPET